MQILPPPPFWGFCPSSSFSPAQRLFFLAQLLVYFRSYSLRLCRGAGQRCGLIRRHASSPDALEARGRTLSTRSPQVIDSVADALESVDVATLLQSTEKDMLTETCHDFIHGDIRSPPPVPLHRRPPSSHPHYQAFASVGRALRKGGGRRGAACLFGNSWVPLSDPHPPSCVWRGAECTDHTHVPGGMSTREVGGAGGRLGPPKEARGGRGGLEKGLKRQSPYTKTSVDLKTARKSGREALRTENFRKTLSP